MRKLFVVCVCIWLVGCSNEAFDKAMADGKKALQSGQYEDAKVAFTRALMEESSDEEAKRLADDAEKMDTVQKLVQQNEWEKALVRITSLMETTKLEESLVKKLEEWKKKGTIYVTNQKEAEAQFQNVLTQIEQQQYQKAKPLLEEAKKFVSAQGLENLFQEQMMKYEKSIQDGVKAQVAKEKAQIAKEKAEKAAKEAAEKKAVLVALQSHYFNRINEVENGLSDLDGLISSGVTTDLAAAEWERYKRWDALLNEIYGVLKMQLSKSEMDALRVKQRAWIKFRDKEGAKAENASGGTMDLINHPGVLATLTEQRCYELVRDYMSDN